MRIIVDGGQQGRSPAYCVSIRYTSNGLKCESFKEVGAYSSFAERRPQGCNGTHTGSVVRSDSDYSDQIGDGINDGPSLAAADVGIMIAHGNKCLSAGGNVLILASKLQSLLTLFAVADGTMKQVRTNVIWALTYNMMAISLAAGLGEPWGLYISP